MVAEKTKSPSPARKLLRELEGASRAWVADAIHGGCGVEYIATRREDTCIIVALWRMFCAREPWLMTHTI